MEIIITAPCPRWSAYDRAVLRAGIRGALAFGAVRKITGARPAAISVMLGSDADLRRLNRDFRGKDKPTNVLSFPAHKNIKDTRGFKKLELGDIALAYETITREAREQGKSRRAHITHMAIHSTLHLLGFDHESDREARVMEGLEIQILGALGLKNPYEIG